MNRCRDKTLYRHVDVAADRKFVFNIFAKYSMASDD